MPSILGTTSNVRKLKPGSSKSSFSGRGLHHHHRRKNTRTTMQKEQGGILKFDNDEPNVVRMLFLVLVILGGVAINYILLSNNK
mmetsp:Transcript_13008/g.24435  ORF Transcript_13008/g.24435 Transcript_13008/m.24435 type:complete len:84 (+) Transcript_13008:72-323(+)